MEKLANEKNTRESTVGDTSEGPRLDTLFAYTPLTRLPRLSAAKTRASWISARRCKLWQKCKPLVVFPAITRHGASPCFVGKRGGGRHEAQFETF